MRRTRGAHDRARAARRRDGLTLPEGEASALARSLPAWPVFDDVQAGLDGGARARLEARDPLEHRPGAHRRVDGGDRRSLRLVDRGRARSARTSLRTATLGGVPRASRARTTSATSTSRRASSTTSRRRRSSASRRSGSTGSTSPRTRARRDPDRCLTSSRTRSTSSCRRERALRVPTEDDAREVAQPDERALAGAGRRGTGRSRVVVRRRSTSSSTPDRRTARTRSSTDIGDGRGWIDVRGDPSRSAARTGPRRDASERAACSRRRLVDERRGSSRELETRGYRPSGTRSRMDDRPRRARRGAQSGPRDRGPLVAPGDERVFYDVHQETFADTWEPIEETYEEWAHGSLERRVRPELWFLASREPRPPASRSASRIRASRASAGSHILGVRSTGAAADRPGAAPPRIRCFRRARPGARRARGRCEEPHRARTGSTSGRDVEHAQFDIYEKVVHVSSLRARCPDCRTFTAVAIGDGYECHSCGREFAAGLVRVPRAWGAGGEAMAEARASPLPYPGDGGRRARHARRADAPRSQTCSPARPLVLGGCCCAHVGAVARARRAGRSARARLDRRARRPEHARDLSVRERVGDAVADAPRRRRRARRRTSRSSARATSIRPRWSTWTRPGSTTRSTVRSRASSASTSRSTRRARPGRGRRASSPSRTDRRSTRSRRCCGDVAVRTPIAGHRRDRASAPTPSRNARASRPRHARRGRLLDRH